MSARCSGETVTGLVVLAGLGIAFAVWKRTWWPLAFVGVFDAGLGLFYLAGTTLDPRQRPPVPILQPGLVPDASFPSGHTGTATAIGGVLAALLWAYTRVARWVLVLLVAIPAYTMLSRLYVGAHHVSDVVTAFVYAGLWLLLCTRMLLPARGSEAQPGSDAGSPSLKQRRQVDHHGHGPLVGRVVVVGRLLDQPLPGMHLGGLAGVDDPDQPRVVAGARHQPGVALLHGVGEDAPLDVPDLGARVMVQREFRTPA